MSPESYFFIAKLFKIAIIVLSVVAAGLFCAPFYLSTKESRKRKKKLGDLYASSDSLDDDEFYKRFYEPRNVPKEIVLKVRRVLADESHPVEITRQLPQDNLPCNCSHQL